MGDAIVRRARGGYQRGELGEGFNGDKDRADRERGTGHAIGHPNGNRGRLLIGFAQPDLTAMSNAPLHGNYLAVQRMPRIVNGDVLSVVGGM